MPALRYFVGVDLGQVSDFTALAVLERPLVSYEDLLFRRKPTSSLRHLRRLPLGTPYPTVVQSVVSLLGAPFLSGCTLAIDQTGVGRAVVDMLADALRGHVSCMFFPITITAGHVVTGDDSGSLHIPRKALVGTRQLLFMRLAEVFSASPLPGSKLVVDHTGVGRPVLDMLRKAKVGASVTPLFVTSGKDSSDDGRGGWLVPRQELAATLQVLLQSRRLRVAPALPESAMLARELAAFEVKVRQASENEMDAWREGAHDDLVLAVAVAAWVSEHAMRRLGAEHFFL